MNFYSESLTKTLQEKIAYFKSAGLNREAELLQSRLKILEIEPAEIITATGSQTIFENAAADAARESLKSKLAAETARIPALEKQYILERLRIAQTLKELEPLRVAYLERLLKISRAARSKNIEPGSVKEATGPYNNEKTFCEALRIIYSQDPLWIEDLKELYFSAMHLSKISPNTSS
jgi:hypothetical protein